jgi:hypothetical protein
LPNETFFHHQDAKNSLVSSPQRTKIKDSKDYDESMDGFQKEDSENEECESEHDEDELGNDETEKLISAITKSLTFFENVGEWQVQILSAQTWQEPREVKQLYLTLAYREDLCMLCSAL